MDTTAGKKAEEVVASHRQAIEPKSARNIEVQKDFGTSMERDDALGDNSDRGATGLPCNETGEADKRRRDQDGGHHHYGSGRYPTCWIFGRFHVWDFNDIWRIPCSVLFFHQRPSTRSIYPLEPSR